MARAICLANQHQGKDEEGPRYRLRETTKARVLYYGAFDGLRMGRKEGAKLDPTFTSLSKDSGGLYIHLHLPMPDTYSSPSYRIKSFVQSSRVADCVCVIGNANTKDHNMRFPGPD